jgi:hypothetical protein
MSGGAVGEAQWRRRLVTELECSVATVVKSDLSLTDVRKALAISGKESIRCPWEMLLLFAGKGIDAVHCSGEFGSQGILGRGSSAVRKRGSEKDHR